MKLLHNKNTVAYSQACADGLGWTQDEEVGGWREPGYKWLRELPDFTKMEEVQIEVNKLGEVGFAVLEKLIKEENAKGPKQIMRCLLWAKCQDRPYIKREKKQ